MKTSFRASFARDLRAIEEPGLRDRVSELIQTIEQAESLAAVPNVKKLHASGGFYRVRVGDYRVGLTVRGNTVSFIRCLHRKEIYRYFP